MPNDYQDIINFIESGVNYDDDLIVIPPGHGRNMRNVVSSDDENFNVKTNVKGNTLPTEAYGGGTFSYPAGTLKVIGFVENKEDKAGIFFVYSSTGKHSIIQYYSESNTLGYVLDGSAYGSMLDFPATGYIDASIVGNEDDKWLIWVSSDNEPMAWPLNGDTPDDATQLSLYRRPLLGELTFEELSDSSARNNLRGKIFQFAVRIKYLKDNTYSVLSSYSRTTTKSQEEFPDGLFVGNNRNSYVHVYFDEIDPNTVLRTMDYQLCYRIIDIGGGAPSEWYISGSDPYYSGGLVNFNFSYGETGVLIPTKIANKIFDYVPDKADRVTVIDTNQIVLGGATEGYDNLNSGDIDIEFTGVTSSMTTSVIASSGTTSIGAGSYTDWVISGEGAALDYYYKLYFTGASTGTVFLHGSYGLTAAQVATALGAQIDDIAGLTVTYPVSGTVRITNGGGTSVVFSRIVLRGSNRSGSFKLGSKLYFGIQYLKDGKPWFVQGNVDSDPDNNPFIYEVPNASELQGTKPILNYYYTLQWQVNHLPPQDATHWQWVYLGDDIDYHEGYLLSREDDFTHDGIYTIINKDFLSKFRKAYGNQINYGFDIQKGDRFRIVGEFDSSAGNKTADQINVFDEDFVMDLEILAVTDTEIKIKNIEFASLWDDPVTDVLLYCQFYRYKQVNPESGIYQAISPIYETYRSGDVTYHKGSILDQSLVQEGATGEFSSPYFSNCFINYQAFINDNNLADYTNPDDFINVYGFMETHNVSLLYPSNIQQFGKPNVINEFAKQRKWNKLRYGGKYLDESGVNFVRSFDYDGEKFLDDRNGIITKLEQIGDTLRAYQERKVTSFYLKATVGTNSDGTQTMVFSNNVMSDGRQSVSDYGCTHFSSYVKTIREAFFFDIVNGVVINDTVGGMVPISDLKMHSYFKQKARDIIEYGEDSVEVLGGWDNDLDMYFITFYIPTEPDHAINDTVGFFAGKKRWEGFYDFIPEFYGQISGNTALTFKSGKVYTQNTNETRNNFFGEQYSSVVDVIAKGDPSKVKTFDSISILSNGQWAPSTDGDIEVPIPVTQQSRLLAGKFKVQEGMYNSEFLRNALDGNSTFVRNRLQTGGVLRGNVIRVRLRNSDTTEANLRLVTINSKISDNGG